MMVRYIESVWQKSVIRVIIATQFIYTRVFVTVNSPINIDVEL